MFKRINSYIIAILAVATLASCQYEKKKTEVAKVMCDNSFENIMEQEIDVFEYDVDYSAIVACRYLPQGDCIDSLIEGKTKAVVIARELTKGEKAKIENSGKSVRGLQIAVDAVAFILNPKTDLDFLKISELADILSGRTKTWSELGPGLPDKPIHVLVDDSRASTAYFLRDKINNGQPLADCVHNQKSIDNIIETVKKDPTTIGVIGVSWLSSDLRDTERPIADRAAELKEDDIIKMDSINSRMDNSGLKVLKVTRNDRMEPYAPYQQNIYDGSYPLTRQVFMYTTAPTSSATGRFYSFVTGKTGQKIMMKTGIMPARVERQIVELTD